VNTQQYDIAMIGRWAGLAIIAIGIIFSIWNAADLDFASGSEKFRYFVTQSLSWVASGGLLFLAAEILDRVRSRPSQ